MMETLETVTITGENGEPVRINKTDFDEKKMKVYKEPKKSAAKKKTEPKKSAAKKTKTPAAPEPKGPNTVIEEDGKFFVVDSEGNKTADVDGYETNAEAWKAAVPQNT